MSASLLNSESAACLRILVADDNTDSAESLAILLRFDGHDVGVAYDGVQALELAETLRPHLAFLDIGMPHLDGYGLAAGIRAHDWGRAVRLVAITGWGQSTARQRALASGFNDHLVKPADPETIQSILHDVAEHQP